MMMNCFKISNQVKLQNYIMYLCRYNSKPNITLFKFSIVQNKIICVHIIISKIVKLKQTKHIIIFISTCPINVGSLQAYFLLLNNLDSLSI